MLAPNDRWASLGGGIGFRCDPHETRANCTDGPPWLAESWYRVSGPPLPGDYAEGRPPQTRAARARRMTDVPTEPPGKLHLWPQRHKWAETKAVSD